jgi:hypothetical protein
MAKELVRAIPSTTSFRVVAKILLQQQHLLAAPPTIFFLLELINVLYFLN